MKFGKGKSWIKEELIKFWKVMVLIGAPIIVIDSPCW